MKLKMGITFAFLCLFSCFSFGQDYKNNIKSIKEIDIKIEKGQYQADTSISADRLIIEISENLNKNQKQTSSSFPYTDEEWTEIKRQILKNKKRVLDNKEIFISKVVDTVFVPIPTDIQNTSQLSGW